MADVVLEAQFKADQAALKEFNRRLKEGEGIVNQLDMRLKTLKAQIKLSTDPADIKNLTSELKRTQAQLDAVNRAAGRFPTGFENALGRAGKRLFDLGNILKASIGFLGVAGIAGKFVEATGAADAMNKAIDGVVLGLKNLNKTQAEIDFSKSTLPLIEKTKKFIESQKPADVSLISELEKEQARIYGTIYAGKPQTVFEKEMKLPIKPLPEEDRKKLQADIDLLQEAIDTIKALKNADTFKEQKAVDAAGSKASNIIQDSPFYRAAAESRTSSAFDEFLFERRQAEINERREANIQYWKEQDELRRKDEEARIESEKRVADARMSSTINFASNFTDLIGQASATGFKNMESLFKQTLQRMMAQMVSSGLLNALKMIINPASAPVSFLGFLGFAEGGYTGRGNKYDPAGIVHRGEVVWNQEDVQRFGGVNAVESIRPTAREKKSTGGNYFNGGEVVPYTNQFSQRQIPNEMTFIMQVDDIGLGKVIYRPNGARDKINRMRSSPE